MGRRATARFLPAIGWAIFIFVASSIPSKSLPSFAIKISDLLIHFFVYTILGVLLSFAATDARGGINWKAGMIIVALGILYGASDEFHQQFVEGRVATISDFVADSAGTVFGVTLFVTALRFRKRPNVVK
jgi:VanZ family protein